ncbi:TonB-dependent receptor plug domain-containing protein [Mucilaginibacter sp. JRF]|uniref:carboxypeptidase-like regulatory domain-containing protein n=1 Tax=Mucilaginibacter sp. JRF TaxID=2780088 RepID=UPI00187E733D|nr:carboxypeptidase-like regulatory domain-containing protein [Mucilaginibacter sp. JRF]MBE9586640.1 TonB-dependent receptor plug domain-containing protein [Mucilaginibacter sp. JRF]
MVIDDPGDKITALLTRYANKFPQQKVHLHLDRNYAAAGDTLNFKAYVVMAENHRLSDTSKILYIDLLDADNGYSTTLNYQIEAGTASGTIEIPDSLKNGNYTLRAYTNWMKNFGEEFFYHAVLKVGNASDNITVAQKQTGNKEDQLYFFAEGGKLVDQLVSVVGFKAIDKQGKGIAVSGSVTDESGKSIASFRSAYAGMGRFSFKPEAGHQYSAVVKFSNGIEKKIPLPQIAESGYVLTANNEDRNEIRATVNYHGKAAGQSVLLVTQANHKVINTTQVNLVNNKATVALKRRDFPTGIAQLTLFDMAAEPLAERLVFINRNDQLRLQLSAPQTTTATNRKLTLKVSDALLNPVNAKFSVAVLDQTLNSDSLNMPSIMADLLLTSDLKGAIENPDRYFKDRSPETALLLDNLMLTQGWRRFNWKDMLAGKDPQLLYPAEKSQSVSGTLLSKKDVPISNGKVMLVSRSDSAFTLNAVTDDKGRFTFDLPLLFEQQLFNLIGADDKGNSDGKITLDNKILAWPETIHRLTASDDQLKKYITANQQLFNNRSKQLKEVVIKAKQPTVTEKALASSNNLNGAGNADQVLTFQDLINCHDLEMCLQGKLTGVSFKSVIDNNSNSYKSVPFAAGGMGKPMLIVLDGVPVASSFSRLNNIPVATIQTIEVLRGGAKLVAYGMQASGGALIITTKNGTVDYNAGIEPLRNNKPVPGLMLLRYNGYHKAREFYNPPANAQGKQNIRMAGTVYWKADLRSNDDGQATIEFKAPANVKKVAIVIEGLSAEGKTGYLYQTQAF